MTYKEYYNRMTAIEQAIAAVDMSCVHQPDEKFFTHAEEVRAHVGLYMERLSAMIYILVSGRREYEGNCLAGCLAWLARIAHVAGGRISISIFPEADVEQDEDLQRYFNMRLLHAAGMTPSILIGSAVCPSEDIGDITADDQALLAWCSLQAELLSSYAFTHGIDIEAVLKSYTTPNQQLQS